MAEARFTAMPSQYYMSVVQMVLRHASSDVECAASIKTLVKDIWDIRKFEPDFVP